MSQLKVNAISDSAGANGNAITLASNGKCAITGSTITADTGKFTNLSNRNLIINGSCIIAQRSTSNTNDQQGIKTVDRYQLSWGGADSVLEQHQGTLTSADTGPWEKGFRKEWHIVNGNQSSGAAAGDYAQMDYVVEAQDMAQSGWDYTNSNSKITFSFWVKSSVSQNFPITIRSLDGTNQAYNMETGTLSANTWTKITKTIPGASGVQFDSDNGPGLRIMMFPYIGTNYSSSQTLNTWSTWASSKHAGFTVASNWWTTDNATFQITGLQLEVGDVATDFEHRSYGDELRRCQRYYEILAKRPGGGAGSYDYMGMWYSASEFTASVRFQVDKRAVPTFEQVSGTNYYTCYGGSLSANINSWTGAQAPTVRATTIYNNNTVSGGTTGHAGWISLGNDAAVLAVSAEL